MAAGKEWSQDIETNSMKKYFLLIITLAYWHISSLAQTDSVTVAVFVPDSVRMKITRTGTIDGKKIIWLKDDKPVKPLRTKGWRKDQHKYITVCPCKKLPAGIRKGKYITIPTSQLEIMRVGVRRQDLEL